MSKNWRRGLVGLAMGVAFLALPACGIFGTDPEAPATPTSVVVIPPTAAPPVIHTATPAAAPPTQAPPATVAPPPTTAPVAPAPAAPAKPNGRLAFADRMQTEPGPAVNMVQAPQGYAQCPSPQVFSEQYSAINGRGPAWRQIGNPTYNGGNRKHDDVCAFEFNKNDTHTKTFIDYLVPAGGISTNNETDHKVRHWAGQVQVTGSAATLRLLDDPKTGLPIYALDSPFRQSCVYLGLEVDYTDREESLGGYPSEHAFGNVACPGGQSITLGLANVTTQGGAAPAAPAKPGAVTPSASPAPATKPNGTTAPAKPAASANGTAPLSGGNCVSDQGAWKCGYDTDKVKKTWTVVANSVDVDIWSGFPTPGCTLVSQSGDAKVVKCAQGTTFTADKLTARLAA